MILSDEYIEIENFLSLEDQEKLIKHLTHPSFPWALSLDSVYGAEGKTIDANAAIGFFHTAMFQGEPCSPELEELIWVIKDLEEKIYHRFKIKHLQRVRVGLFTKHPDPTPHKPHVDATFPHWTCVYYVNDCDGDLIVHNETYPEVPQENAKTHQFTTKRVCKPAQGKLVTFNGKYYHSSSYPTQKPLRLAITFNFTLV